MAENSTAVRRPVMDLAYKKLHCLFVMSDDSPLAIKAYSYIYIVDATYIRQRHSCYGCYGCYGCDRRDGSGQADNPVIITGREGTRHRAYQEVKSIGIITANLDGCISED